MRLAFLLLLACLLIGTPASASDLTLDGQSSALSSLYGSTLTIEVVGNPNLPCSMIVDLAPGPTAVNGVPFPIGFSPAWSIFPLGVTSPLGELSKPITLPNDPSTVGLIVYTACVVFDPTATSGLDVSNGVALSVIGNINNGKVQLAGNTLSDYPHFEHVTAFNEGASIKIGIETSLYPGLAGTMARVYVVKAKNLAQWTADPSLVDVSSGGAEVFSFVAGSIQNNILEVDAGTLNGINGTQLGVGYDVVIDVNNDGLFSPGDIIDGNGDETGLYVVHDLTLPGPLPVTEILYSGGVNLAQNTFYPSNISNMGQLPLIVISHGNGHNYQWYDHLGEHMASYGYVVMSHQNNTQPGIETASTTTLTNTDYFLGNLASIQGGALNGHIDASRIVWLGHSRGGEGVARAYDRLFDGTFVPTNYGIGQITLISSIAPTGFLSTSSSNPHNVEHYHVWTGAADADVNGCASSNITQTQQIHDRAAQGRSSISLHGVGHGDFHNSSGSVASGPCLVGKPSTHAIMRGYFLPLVKHVIEGNAPAKDYLWRQWERFQPIGAPTSNNCVVVDLQHSEGPSANTFVIDDFQTNSALNMSSSGGPVTATVANMLSGKPDDGNSNFTNNSADPFNGFTYARANDRARALVFEYNSDTKMTFGILGPDQDFSDFAYLSFRSCQATRHPFTTSALGDTTFSVVLSDTNAVSSQINIGAYGGGLEEPYQRTGCGSGTGWHNEYETIRIRLTDFLNDGSGLDLTSVASVSLYFGPSFGSPEGRLGLDDLKLTLD